MKKHYDLPLIIVTAILVLIGLVMVSSSSVVLATQQFGSPYYYFKHQFFIGFIGGGIFCYIMSKIDYGKLKKFAPVFLFLSFLMLILVFIPGIGMSFGGAQRWIKLGLSFQPSEFVKLGVIIYLAAWLSKDKESVQSFTKSFLPFVAVICAVSILLLKQPDTGTMGIIAVIAITMFFTAGGRFSHIFIFITGLAGVLWGLIKIAPYRMNRFLVFLNPSIDPKGIGYHINQALIAIGSGGIFGMGFGHSRQKFNYLPEPIGDSIFAIIAEELGLIGGAIILVLFGIFAWRGFRIAKHAPDKFGMLLAVGITSWIIFQAIINIAAITSLMPLTGITLPFISYGSSSLVMSLGGVGILINISKQI
ncbi:MAG: putative lipid II flippase FtsW [bacterium]